MKPTTSIRNLTLALSLGAFLPTGLSAATTYNIGFDTDGDFEGFTNFTNIDTTPVPPAVSGGLLSGVAAGGDPRITNTTTTFSKPSGETWSTVVFRVRETDSTNSSFLTSFSSTGMAIVLNSTAITTASLYSATDSGSGFFTVTADVSSFTANDITSFRFDPIGGTDANNNTFQVDFVQINAIPEPSSALLGALGALCLLRRRR